MPLGLLLAAPVAGIRGVGAWSLAAGLACIAMGIAGFFLPSLMRMEEPQDTGITRLAFAGRPSGS